MDFEYIKVCFVWSSAGFTIVLSVSKNCSEFSSRSYLYIITPRQLPFIISIKWERACFLSRCPLQSQSTVHPPCWMQRHQTKRSVHLVFCFTIYLAYLYEIDELYPRLHYHCVVVASAGICFRFESETRFPEDEEYVIYQVVTKEKKRNSRISYQMSPESSIF